MMNQALTPYEPLLLGILRIVAALVIFSYGTQKILDFPASQAVPWIAGLFELVAGFLVLVGFRTRVAAFVLSGVIAFAYFLAHAPQGFYPAQNGGVPAILFCFVFLYLAAAGAARSASMQPCARPDTVSLRISGPTKGA